MAVTAQLVKELRERTGAGMMECKRALTETDGDIEKAIENMRSSGAIKAAKKEGRITAEGIVAVEISADGKHAAMVEVNCETDFVARNDDFVNFAQELAQVALTNKAKEVSALSQAKSKQDSSKTLEEIRQTLVTKLGENLNVRRICLMDSTGIMAHYTHGTRIGVLVAAENASQELAKDIAMHVAALNPAVVNPSDVPAELVAKEKEIFVAQAQESGKPADIIEKMVAGRVKKFLEEVSLLGQPFVKDPNVTVEKLLASHKAAIKAFQRFEVGEGIEKQQGNFAEEVMAQVRETS